MINDINNNRWMISIDYHFPLCVNKDENNINNTYNTNEESMV